MKWIATALCSLVIALGAIGIASPETLIAIGRHFTTPAGLWLAAALRVAFGGALFAAAPASRAPRALRAIGAFIAAVGLVTPLFGTERAGSLLDAWSSQPVALQRACLAIAPAFAAGLLWALHSRTGSRAR